MKVTEETVYVGVNDHEVDLFEGQYAVPAGMAYNSYVICDEKTAVMDSVDTHFAEEWLNTSTRRWAEKRRITLLSSTWSLITPVPWWHLQRSTRRRPSSHRPRHW